MKVMFVSLGCDKNLVDTENMLGILNDRGFTFTDDEMDNRIKNVNRIAHKFREVAILYTQRRR